MANRPSPRGSVFIAWAVAVLAAATLLAWVAARSLLPMLSLSDSPMKPATALLLLAVAVVLVRVPRRSVAGRVVMAAVAAVAAETVVTISLGVGSLTSASLFPQAWLDAAPDGTGRMAMGTAVGLLALALALLTGRRRVATALSGLAFLLAYAALLGYLYDVEGFYSLQSATAMAPASAISLALLSVAVVLRPGMPLQRLLAERGAAGTWARQLLPWALLAPPAVGRLDLAGREAGLFGSRYGIALMVLAFAATTLVAVFFGARAAARIDAARTRALDELELLNAVLEERVAVSVAEAEEGRERLRILLERTPVGIFETAPDGTRRFTNQRWREIAGVAEGSGAGGTWTDVLHPDDRDWVVRDWQAAIAAGSEWSARYRYLRPDGSVAWVEAVAVAVRNSDGEVQRWLGSITDVTEQVIVAERLAASEQRYRSVVTTMVEGVLFQDSDGRVLTANDAACRLLGVDRDDLLAAESTHRFWDAVHEDGTPYLPQERPSLLALSTGEPVRDRTLGIRRGDGTHVWLSVNAEPVLDRETGGGVAGVVTTFADVTEARSAAAALRRSEEQFRNAMEHAPIGMALVELDGRFRQVNPALSRIVGYTEDELVRMTFQEITHRDDLDADLENLRRLLAGDVDHYTMPKRYRTRSGELVWVQLAVSCARDADGRPDYLVAQVQDITADKAATDLLAHRALHDGLTGLPNRDLLMDHLAHALARSSRTGLSTAVMFCDLDGFKEVNDGHGHDMGDRLLVEVADRLRRAVRPGDTVSRLGGDEFVVVAEDLQDVESARALAERVRRAIGESLSLGTVQVRVEASIGVALSAPEDDARSVLRAADAAMYRAKARGRNCVELSTGGSPLAPVMVAEPG